ncbi:MAG: sulfite exporter TauE/SafE family protein [Marinobacterium sp.]|nr:sulfite exporter TauE/SafE family protein [Marinobacterium sp.]
MNPEMLGAGIGAGFGAAFMIGLSFGSGPCNLTCLPYLGPMMLGPAAQRPFYAALLPFMLGRLLGYIALGVTAALLGEWVAHWLEHPAIPLLVALVTGWLALRLWVQSGQTQSVGCTAARPPVIIIGDDQEMVQQEKKQQPADNASLQLIATDAIKPASERVAAGHEHTERNWLQLLLLGMTLALNPCLPLLGLLAAATQSGSAIVGALLALAFGLGAVLIPSLLVRYGVALLGQTLREQLAHWRIALARTGAALLMLIALSSGWQGVVQLSR